jgi:hypothetical protein
MIEAHLSYESQEGDHIKKMSILAQIDLSLCTKWTDSPWEKDKMATEKKLAA